MRKPHKKAAMCPCGAVLYPIFSWTHGKGSHQRTHVLNYGYCRECEKLYKITVVEVE